MKLGILFFLTQFYPLYFCLCMVLVAFHLYSFVFSSKCFLIFIWFLPWLTCYLEVFHFQLYTNFPEIFVNVKFFCSHKIYSVWIESFQIWDFCYHPGLTHSKGSMCTWRICIFCCWQYSLSVGLIWLIA